MLDMGINNDFDCKTKEGGSSDSWVQREACAIQCPGKLVIMVTSKVHREGHPGRMDKNGIQVESIVQ